MSTPGFDPTFKPSGTGHRGGTVPDPGGTAGTARYLREDASFSVPAGGNVPAPAPPAPGAPLDTWACQVAGYVTYQVCRVAAKYAVDWLPTSWIGDVIGGIAAGLIDLILPEAIALDSTISDAVFHFVSNYVQTNLASFAAYILDDVLWGKIHCQIYDAIDALPTDLQTALLTAGTAIAGLAGYPSAVLTGIQYLIAHLGITSFLNIPVRAFTRTYDCSTCATTGIGPTKPVLQTTFDLTVQDGTNRFSFIDTLKVSAPLAVSDPSGATAEADLALTTPLAAGYGGTGLDGSAALAGDLLFGTGSGFELGQLLAGANVTITRSGTDTTIAATGADAGSGQSGTVSITIPPGSGTATAAVTFSPSFGAAPHVNVSSDTGTVIATAESVTDTGFTARITCSDELPTGESITAVVTWHVGAGAPGATGATGPAGMTWRGAWSNSTAYAVNDAVDDGSPASSYICIATHTGHEPPNATYWQLLAAAGATGSTGATGSAGATGATGPAGPGMGYGLLSARPAAGTAGYLYYATDTDLIYRDNGTAWSTLGLSASAIVAGTLAAARGGTGLDGSAAGNGTLPIGNGSGFTLANILGGTNITVTNTAGGITIAASGVAGGITTGGAKLSADVTMSSTDTYYDSCNVSLAAGTYLLISGTTVDATNGNGHVTAKLWDGSTVAGSGEQTQALNSGGRVFITLAAIVTPSTTTTYKTSAAIHMIGTVTTKIKATATDNGAGNTASWIVYAKLG